MLEKSIKTEKKRKWKVWSLVLRRFSICTFSLFMSSCSPTSGLALCVSGFPVLPLVLSWWLRVAGLMVDQSSVLGPFRFNKCRNKFIIVPNPLKTRLRTCLPCRSCSLATLLASANNHLKRKYFKNPWWKVNERVVWERAWLEPAADKLEQVWKVSAKTWNSVSLVQIGRPFS